MFKLRGKFNVPFLINKRGFPLDNETWDEMIDFASFNNEDDRNKIIYLSKIKVEKTRPYPTVPTLEESTNIQENILKIQTYMNELEYNYTGTQFYVVDKFKPLSNIMHVAENIIYDSLPIKCLEALVLGIYFTNRLNNIERFAIGFMSMINGSEHRHIVLGLHSCKMFGSIGMSRRKDLMYKPLIFETLYDLIMDFKKSYENNNHILHEIFLSHLIPHNNHCVRLINWQYLTINFTKMTFSDIKISLKKYSLFIMQRCAHIDKLKSSEVNKSTRMKKHILEIISKA